jgi:hypothetical protein
MVVVVGGCGGVGGGGCGGVVGGGGGLTLSCIDAWAGVEHGRLSPQKARAAAAAAAAPLSPPLPMPPQL